MIYMVTHYMMRGGNNTMSKMKDLVMLNSERVLNDPKYNNFRTSSIIEVNESLDFKVVDDLVEVAEPEDDENVTIISEDDTTLLLKNDFENMSKREFNEVYNLNQQELSPLEERFVVSYCDSYNGTEAAVQAGYTRNRASASVQASRLLKKDYIKQAVTMRPIHLAYTHKIATKQDLRYKLTQMIEDVNSPDNIVLMALDRLAKLDFHYEKEVNKDDNTYTITVKTSKEAQRLLDVEAQKELETLTQPLDEDNNLV